MDETPQSPRYTLEQTADGVQATIPAARHWATIVLLSVWLAVWAFGEARVATQLLGAHWRGATVFLTVWLLGWSLAGLMVLTTVIWQVAGREIITVSRQRLSRRIEAFGFGRTRSYAMQDVRDLRATPYINHRFAQQRVPFPWIGGTTIGSIAFDYGARTIRFAPGMDEAEAKMLVAELIRRL